MAIVKMKKFTLLSMERSKDALLRNFQRQEQIHFKDMNKEDSENFAMLHKFSSQREQSFYESELAKVSFLIDKIRPYADLPTGLTAMRQKRKIIDFDSFDDYELKNYNHTYQAIKDIEEAVRVCDVKINQLILENETLLDWSVFDSSTRHVNKMKTSQCVFGVISRMTAERMQEEIENEFPNAYIEIVEKMRDEYFLSILLHHSVAEKALQSLRNLGFVRVNQEFDDIPNQMICRNQTTIASLTQESANLATNMKNYAAEYEDLLVIKECLLTSLERVAALDKCKTSESLLFIEGWYPLEDESMVINSIEGACGKDYFLETIDVSKDDLLVPIKLKNNAVFAPFESIVEMFSLPTYGEMDPTVVMMPFYFMTFGLMVGDAGYGLLIFLLTGAALFFLDLQDGTKNFITIFFILSFAIMLAGLLYGSFFGFGFFQILQTPEGVPRAIIDSDYDTIEMLLYAVIFGFIQIIFGLLVKGYMALRDKDIAAFLFDSILWIVTLFSGVGLLLGAANILSSDIMNISKWVFIISLIGLALTQGRSSPTTAGKIASGLYEVYGLANYVGDFVSYTRIAALALSGAYIAFSFNLMAGLIPSGKGIIGVILLTVARIIILILGHALNLGLSMLGAYVHTSRLQYVEYFGKFYNGGGIKFSPLAYRNNTVKVTKS